MFMSFLPQEFKKHNSSRKALGALMMGVLLVRIVSTALYFKKNGIRSSYGGDIWFFMGVSQGHERLFWGDPLQYLLPLLGKLSPENLFDVLLVASNGFHLVSIALLFLFCLEMTKNVSASFWAAAVYSVTMTAFNFCTASFHHQQSALPFLVGCLWIAWKISSEGFTWLRGMGLLVLSCLSLSMGPDVFVILIVLIPLSFMKLEKYAADLIPLLLISLWVLCLVWIRDQMNSSTFRISVLLSGIPLAAALWFRGFWRNKQWIFSVLLLAVWIGLVFLLGPWGEQWFETAAAKSRGIDLSAQKLLRAEDLLPFGLRELWAAYPWVSILFIAILFHSWKRGRYFEGFVVVTAFLFAGFAARFYFIAEMGIALVIAWFLSIQTRPKILHISGAALTSALLIIAAVRGVACLYPGMVWKTLEPLRTQKEKQVVLCTPTYGFLVKSLTGHQPTSDWHHLNNVWMHTASQKAEPAVKELKRLGVTYAFFTSVDLRIVETDVDGTKVPMLYDSGGFELPSVLEDVQETFAYRVLYDPQDFEGLTRVRREATPDGEGKAVLARLP
jgi:hypothetical protein